ncbi:mucoidy inhibitor MuiA family protein [Aeoliella sp. SH292]|uniref:mucoidy inhibitor MuiA family protein n=1 Tax=Aeoliella sp. SH292 TaxID=3454464 RepID=UPI003F9D66FE
MMRHLLIYLLALLLLPSAWAADAPSDDALVVAGEVTAVTVYQGQALVTRTVDLAELSGLTEVVVTNLPENVLPASLYAEPRDGVEIRSVRYRVRPMELDVRDEVRALDAQLEETQDGIASVQRQQQLLAERLQYMSRLEQFTTVTADHELRDGVLNAETLKELTGFNFEQRSEIAKGELELARELRDLQRQLETLARKRGTVAAGSAQTLREAVVFVNVKEAGGAGLKLSYLVSNATWSPSYNLRASSERDKVLVEYNAAIQQMSGEDWTDVAMTLSTATPSLVAQAPALDTLVIKLGRDAPELVAQAEMAGKDYKEAKSELEQQRRQIADARGNAIPAMGGLFDGPVPASEPATAMQEGQQAAQQQVASVNGPWGGRDRQEADRFLNDVAQKMQILDYNTARVELKKADERQMVEGEGVSVSYKLASRMTLPSRSDRQLIQISAHPLKADFYRLAIPVLTGSVFEEARATNTSNQVLLAGPASTFLGDEFVGRGEVPTVSVGEQFSVGLGIDTSLRTSRELVDKTERTQGGNRVVDFTYELAIENFGDAPAQVRLLDRMPTAGEADIRITLVKSDKPVSEDRAYQQRGLEEGMLRWDVEVPAGATGVDRFVMKYTIQIEYDKQLSIVGLPAKR